MPSRAVRCAGGGMRGTCGPTGLTAGDGGPGEGVCQLRCLKRQLSLPVSMISQ